MPNLLNISTWTEGSGTVGYWSQNGVTVENYRYYAQDPWNQTGLIWEAISNGSNTEEGGWSTSNNTNIDANKLYRFSVWCNRTAVGVDGSFYFGTYGYDSGNSQIGVYNRDNGVLNINPYFYSTSSYTPLNTWILNVGHVYPSGDGIGSMHNDSGRYTITGGKIATNSRDFYWHPSNVKCAHRTYLYYNTDAITRQRWIYPRIDLIDGSEPTIAQLLRNGEYYMNIAGGLGFLSVKCKDVFN